MSGLTSNTGYEKNVGIDGSDEHTPIHLPPEKNSFNGNIDATVAASDEFAPTQRVASSSCQSVASTVPTLLSFKVHPLATGNCGEATTCVWQICFPIWLGVGLAPGNWMRTTNHIKCWRTDVKEQERSRCKRCANAERQNLQKKSWNEKLNRPFVEKMKLRKENLKLKLKLTWDDMRCPWRERSGQGNQKMRPENLEMALRLIENLNLNGYNNIKRICGLTLLRERIALCGELEMRNRLFLESRTKDCQEIE